MTTAVEELQEEVVGVIHTLNKDNLLEICDFLNISEDVKGKFRITLMTHIMKHIEREELTELEDEGMAELLLKDKIADVISGIDSSNPTACWDGRSTQKWRN